MNVFEDFPTTDLVQELLDRIEYSNGLDFVQISNLLKLKRALDAQCRKISETSATFTPRSLGVQAPQKPPVDFMRDPWGNPENPFMRMQRQWRAAIDQVSQMEMRYGLR